MTPEPSDAEVRTWLRDALMHADNDGGWMRHYASEMARYLAPLVAERDQRMRDEGAREALAEVEAAIRGHAERLGDVDVGRHRNGLFAAVGIIAAARAGNADA